MKKYIKRSLLFLIFWFIAQSIFHFIYNPSGIDTATALQSNPDYSNAISGSWIFIILLIYAVKVWKVKKSLLWKLFNGLLVWIVGSVLGSILGGIIFYNGAIGMILVAFFLFVFPFYEYSSEDKKNITTLVD